MNKLFSRKLWLIMTLVMASVLVVFIVGNNVAQNYSTLLNQTLKLETYRVVDDGSGGDSIYFTADYKTKEEIQKYSGAVCEELEAEGLVLLKNENGALPLKDTEKKVSLFGTGAAYLNCSVQGASTVADKTAYPTLKAALEAVGMSVNGELWDFYNTGAAAKYGRVKKLDAKTNLQTYYINEAPWELYDAVAGSFASFGDAAIVVLSRDSGEGSDPSAAGSDGADGNYLALSAQETELLVELSKLKAAGTFGKVVVLLNSALPLQLDFLKAGNIAVDACMWIGNTGMTGVYAVAKALTGEVNPSGRLTDTYVYDNFSSPAMASWTLNDNRVFSASWADERLNATQRYYGVYNEGIYVGYRYYETRYADVVEGRQGVGNYDYAATVAYPFGYGLSYTEFAYDQFTVSENADGMSYDVSVRVTNTGSEAGKETVQIYLGKPYTPYAVKNGMEVAAVELVGFGKTAELAAGAAETLTVNVEKEHFASYDVYGAETYVLDAGDYYLAAGKDAHDATNNILAKKGFTAAAGMDAAGNAALAWKTNVAERDVETYAVSAETGGEITNALESMDMNRYYGGGSNLVTYVSRNNWTATWPSEKIVFELTEDMASDLESEKPIASAGAPPTYGAVNGLTLSMMRGKDFAHEDWDKLLDQMTFEEQNTLLTNGYCITAAVPSVVKPQTKGMDGPTYCKESKNECRFPCEGIWASTFNRELIAKVGVALANDTLNTGYHEMWVPGINIHRTPYGGRGHEYFSEDPYLTGVAAQAQIEAMQKYGVIAYPKHFAINDQEANRNGIGTWLNEQSAREIYLKPWKYACSPKRGNAHGVMSSFNRVGCVWASAHKGMIGILRQEFGFNGIILTDMADANGTIYMTVLDGLQAGTDIWFSSGKDHSFEKYRNNATVAGLMREASHRILYNVCNYSAAMNGYSSTTKIIRIYTWWEILLTTMIVTFGVLTAASLAMLAIGKYRQIKDSSSAS